MPDIGSTLREARMRERIDISEVEATTKIRAKYLRAIENEEWDLLPGPVYAKSFLRTYGDYLGLDSRMLVDEFRRRHEGPSEHELRPVSRPPRERDRHARPRRAPSWAPIVLVALAVVAILYVVGSLPGSNSSNSSGHRSTASRRTVRRSTAKRVPTRPVVPTSVTLQMTPTNAVYVCLVDGAGKKLINEQTFTVGQAIPTEKAARLLLTLGNNFVKLKVNGKVVPLAPSPTAIRLLLTPGRVQHISDSLAPTCP